MTKLPPTVILLGFTSLFTDVGSEMIFPLLPVFVTVTLGASPALLGVVEGAAYTVSSVLKLAAGRLSDRLGKRRPPGGGGAHGERLERLLHKSEVWVPNSPRTIVKSCSAR